MTFDDIIQHLQTIADGLEVKTITLDHRERMLLGNMVIDSHENVDELRYHHRNALLKLLKDLKLETTESIDTISSVKQCTLLYHTLHESYSELGSILLDHSADPRVAGVSKEDSIMLAARLHKYDFLEAFGGMVPQPAPAAKEEYIKPEKNYQAEVEVNHHREERYVAEKNPQEEDRDFSEEVVYQPQSFGGNVSAASQRVPTRLELEASDLVSATQYLLTQDKVKALVPHAVTTMVAETNVLTHYKHIVEKLVDSHKQKSVESKAEEAKQYLSDKQVQFLESKRQHYKAFFQRYSNSYRIGDDRISLTQPYTNHAILTLFPATPCAGKAILPEDREVMAASLALLKEYADFTIWHFNRGYRDRAFALLHHHLGNRFPIRDTEDFLILYREIKEEFRKISACNHHGNVKNNFFNSSYYRRLDFIIGELERTELVMFADKLEVYEKTLVHRNDAANLIAPVVEALPEELAIPEKVDVNATLIDLTEKAVRLFSFNIVGVSFTEGLQGLMREVDQLYFANKADFVGDAFDGTLCKLAELKITLLENAFYRAWELSWGMGALMSYRHIENVQAAKLVYLNLVKEYLAAAGLNVELVKRLQILILSNANSLLACDKTNPVSFFKAKPFKVAPEVERLIFAALQRPDSGLSVAL